MQILKSPSIYQWLQTSIMLMGPEAKKSQRKSLSQKSIKVLNLLETKRHMHEVFLAIAASRRDFIKNDIILAFS